jgi:hypothetical protein
VSARCTYLLPIRRTRAGGAEIAAFSRYFESLAAAGCEVLVVDGSPPGVFAAHHEAWATRARHVGVDPQYPYLNGKVNGIHTGVAVATCERIILADDDIRYTAENVGEMCRLLDDFDLVRPQNYLSPLPWWARMEAARMLVNRGVLRNADYPGTCGIRRSAMLRVGHYDGDVLFDNEEIVRHFIVNGATVCHANDFFVLKRPPTLRKWREQRPRQAYEDFGMRAKTAAFMAVVPLAAATAAFGGVGALLGYIAAISGVSLLLAERGRRRGTARRHVPWHVPLHAPLWVLERSLSVYWAIYWRIARGGYPFGDVLLSKGVGRAWSAAAKAPPRGPSYAGARRRSG